MAKLQEILDAAWKAVQPIEEDPAKKKKLEKQCVAGRRGREAGGASVMCASQAAQLSASCLMPAGR